LNSIARCRPVPDRADDRLVPRGAVADPADPHRSEQRQHRPRVASPGSQTDGPVGPWMTITSPSPRREGRRAPSATGAPFPCRSALSRIPSRPGRRSSTRRPRGSAQAPGTRKGRWPHRTPGPRSARAIRMIPIDDEGRPFTALLERRLNRMRREYEAARARPDRGRLHPEGSLQDLYTSCGNPNCRCLDPEHRHGPYWHLTWKEQGKTTTRRLSVEYPALYRKWIANRRRLEAVLEEHARPLPPGRRADPRQPRTPLPRPRAPPASASLSRLETRHAGGYRDISPLVSAPSQPPLRPKTGCYQPLSTRPEIATPNNDFTEQTSRADLAQLGSKPQRVPPRAGVPRGRTARAANWARGG